MDKAKDFIQKMKSTDIYDKDDKDYKDDKERKSKLSGKWQNIF